MSVRSSAGVLLKAASDKRHTDSQGASGNAEEREGIGVPGRGGGGSISPIRDVEEK